MENDPTDIGSSANCNWQRAKPSDAPARAALDRARRIVREHVPSGVNLAEELIAERRLAAREE